MRERETMMARTIFWCALLSGWVLSGQGLTMVNDLTYPQTPNFTDQVSPATKSANVDTVSSLRKASRMSSRTDKRERFGSQKFIQVLPGGLEPNQEYLLPLDKFFRGAVYKRGSFAFSGPADALVGVTNFAWGTENNNANFLPLLVRADYQDIQVPSYNFTWSMQPEYRRGGGVYSPEDGQISLNYEFKVPAQASVDWGDDKSFRRFYAGGTVFGKSPGLSPGRVLIFSGSGLECYGESLKESRPVGWRLSLPFDFTAAGFAVAGDMLVLAESGGRLTAFDRNGAMRWNGVGNGPLMFYGGRLFAISADYRAIVCLNPADGKERWHHALPDFLPRHENAFAALSSSSGDLLLLSVPNQSRMLCYLISPGGGGKP